MFDVKRVLIGLVFLLVIIALLLPATLLAQDDSEEKLQEKSEKQKKIDRLFKMSLEELMDVRITTAGKISQRIGDIPASVVLITRDDIETYGYQTLTEILENIPGLFAIDDYSENGANFGVRGFWSGVPNDNMVILVNGVHQVNDYYSSYPLNKIIVPVEAIDRIEIIRGPMSVVYGNGAFYGVINIITNEPTAKIISMISVSGGTLNTKKLFARVSGKKGKFHYVFNSSIFDTDGMDKLLGDMMIDPSILPLLGPPLDSRTGGRMENTEKYFNFSGSFKDFAVDMTYSEGKKEFYFSLPSVADGSSNHIVSSDVFIKYGNELSKEVTIVGKFSYHQSRNSFNYDFIFPDFYGIQILNTSAFEVELNTFIKPGPKVDITIGANYRAVLEASNLFDLPSFGNPFFGNTQIFLAESDDIITRALFAQVDYSPSKKFKLIAGLRLEQTPKYELKKIQSFGAGPFEKSSAIFERNEVEFIPRLALMYYFNDTNIIKFLYGQAINRPSFAQNYQNTLLALRDDALEPESIQTFELNYISSFSSRFSLNASIFRNTLDKLITRVVFFNPDGSYESWSDNTDKSVVTHGIELTINAEPIEYLRMELSGTYQKTDDKRTGFENIDVAYSPKFLGYLKANYLGVGFKIAVTGTYVGSMEPFYDITRPNPDGSTGSRIGEKVGGYFLLGANLRIDEIFADGLFLNIRCSNLLDTEIRYPTFTNTDWATRGTISAGRTFLVTLGYKF